MTLTVVTGPPCSGKTTLVDQRRAPADVVIDLDRLAVALGHLGDRIDWLVWHPAREAARAARRAVTDAIDADAFHARAWLVDTSPHPTSLRIWERRGVEIINLDPGHAECRRRAMAAGRSGSTHQEIDRWYSERGLPMVGDESWSLDAADLESIGAAPCTFGQISTARPEKSRGAHPTPETSEAVSPRHRPENSEQPAGGLGPRG